MPFDLKLIESYVNVAETLSFSEAARRSNTVQSAVSSHIKALEELTNRSLLNRGRGQPVHLTADGAAFLVQARRLLLLADEMRHPANHAISETPLRLGTTVTFALSIVPRVLAANSSGAAAPAVTVRTARSHELMTLLEEGQIDVALVLDQGPHPMRQSLIEVELAWAGAETFKGPRHGPLPLAFLDDARDLRRHAYSALDASSTVTKTSLTTHPDPIGLRAVLCAGIAVTILPRPAIVFPLQDVGKQLALPHLRNLPVSVYTAQTASADDLKKLSDLLISELTRM